MLQSSGVEFLPFLVFSCLRNWNGSEWEADTEKGGICVQVVQKEEVSWSGPRTKKYSTASIKELEQNRWNPASFTVQKFPNISHQVSKLLALYLEASIDPFDDIELHSKSWIRLQLGEGVISSRCSFLSSQNITHHPRQHRPFPKLIFFSILLFHLFEEL